MSESTEVCIHCAAALCNQHRDYSPHSEIPCKHNYFAAVHHTPNIGGYANEQCVRPKRVVVKGCFECRFRHPTRSVGKCAHPYFKVDGEPRIPTKFYWDGMPEWCPLNTDRGKAGVLIVADRPVTDIES